MDLTPRQRVWKQWLAHQQERLHWVSTWQDLADNIQPWRARFLQSDRTSSPRRNTRIYNSHPRWAARVLASGMMAGITSPARPWFRLGTPDPKLAEHGPVRTWLYQCEEAIRTAFARSNLYTSLHSVYEDLGTFGTAALFVDEDTEQVMRGYSLPIGSYALALSDRLAVNTLFRELTFTVAQAVKRFGLDKVSQRVKEQHTRREFTATVELLHVIEPREVYDPGKSGSANMAWRSCWLEADKALEEDQKAGFLRESGYNEFPVLAPRWGVTGEDVYGAGPGLDALGDCRGLQLLEKRKATLVDKTANPPMKGPSSLHAKRASLLPGDYTAVDTVSGGQSYEPAMVVPPQAIVAVAEEIRRHEQRIGSAFYADLWLMLAGEQRSNVTAREIAERHEEKMLQLGPVMERLQNELLDPLIDRAFAILLRRGRLPPPPEELQGEDLRVEFISVMAQAQKMVRTTGLERLGAFVGQLAQGTPSVLDKVNFDEVADQYADAVGVPPDVMRSDDEVAELRAERAKQQAAVAQGEAMAAAAKGVRDLGAVDLEGDNAAKRILAGPMAAVQQGVPS